MFIEISARTGGGFIPQCYEKYFGANIQEMHYKAQMGLPVPSFRINQNSAWCWFPIKIGEIKKINTPVIKSRFQLTWLYKNGDKLDQSILNNSNTHPRVGEMIIWHKDFATVEKDFDFLSSSFIPYQVTKLT